MYQPPILEILGVSRETILCLQKYVEILIKWNKSINLVSKTTVYDSWSRHIEDSAQLWQFVSESDTKWVDFGSGAGFPGLVIAIIAKEKNPNMSVVLIESDERKCIFLNEIARITGVEVKVLNDRIEKIPYLDANIVSARALSSLENLMFYSKLHRKINGKSLFLKGKKVKSELRMIQEKERFDFELIPSYFQKSGFVLKVGNQIND